MADMLAILLLATLAAPPGEGRIVERIVAVVRNPVGSTPRPIFQTQLVGEARVALIGKGAMGAATAPLDAAALRASLSWLVDQLLVENEAVRLKVGEPTKEKQLAELQRFRERFGGQAAYQAFLASADLTEDDVRAALTRDLRVQSYLESRLGRSSHVRDDEVTAALKAEGTTSPSPEARAAAVSRLKAEKAESQMRQFLAELRSRADIRVLVPELREDAR
jgi:hypothetical protein